MLIPLFIVFLVLLWMTWVDRERLSDGWSSYAWQPVKATVMDIRDEEIQVGHHDADGSHSRSFRGRSYTYEYEAGGRTYQSMRYSFEDEGRHEMSVFEVGDLITVYHDPSDPRRAVIRRGLGLKSLFVPVLTLLADIWLFSRWL